MNKLIDNNETLTINCPNCNQETEIKLSQIGSSILCDNCEHSIELTDDDLLEELDKVNESFDELINNLNDLSI